MNSDWETAIEFVLKEEGGELGELVKNDKGGYTRFGISSAAHPNVELSSLTRDGAKEIYKKEYWQACRCDELPSPLAIAVFDAAVNQGEGAAKRMLQMALNVEVDGIIGDQTITAAFKYGPRVARSFLARRMSRYIRTVMKDPTQEVFADNWSNRLMRCAQLVLKDSQS